MLNMVIRMLPSCAIALLLTAAVPDPAPRSVSGIAAGTPITPDHVQRTFLPRGTHRPEVLFTGDGLVNVSDLLHVIAGWGDPWDIEDLLLVIASWGGDCS